MGYASDDHKSRSHKIRVLKTGYIITKTKMHVKATLISAEDYLRKEMSKDNRPQADFKLDELTDCFALLNHHKYLKNLEINGIT